MEATFLRLRTGDDLRRIVTPIGLAIDAETPAEIAVSITAQLIGLRAARRREKGESLLDGGGKVRSARRALRRSRSRRAEPVAAAPPGAAPCGRGFRLSGAPPIFAGAAYKKTQTGGERRRGGHYD